MKLKTMRQLIANVIADEISTPNDGDIRCYPYPPHHLELPCAEIRPDEGDGSSYVSISSDGSTFCSYEVSMVVRFHLIHNDNDINHDQIDDWVDSVIELFPIDITAGTDAASVDANRISSPLVFTNGEVTTLGFDAEITIT